MARFDLSTGMAIPYIIVTSCLVIAAGFSFHGKVDEAFLSSDPAVMQSSDVFKGASGVLTARLQKQLGMQAATVATEVEKDAWKSGLSDKDQQLAADKLDARFADALGTAAWDKLSPAERDALMAELPEAEKRLAGTLVKRDAFQLAQSLADADSEGDHQDALEKVAVIRSESGRLSRLIGNVLTFARQKRKTLQLQPRDEVPGRLIGRIVDRFRPAFAEQKIDVQMECDTESRLNIDPDFLEQILGNLISNVEKYASSGKLLKNALRGTGEVSFTETM